MPVPVSLKLVAPHLTGHWLRNYRRLLLPWFAVHRRDLPWRQTSDPYAIWISESMLQQTQVATVIDYYIRFLNTFPTVAALAAAQEQEVLAMWAGLGYYRRARQMHAAAKMVMAEFAGVFPKSAEEILSLPGVGRYTAGAVASIAYDQPAPIVEANTQRVYSRLLKQPAPTTDVLWLFAKWLLPQHGSGQLNQAAMELGSLVCKPVEPKCLLCPIVSLCPTAAAGLQNAIPAAKPKKQFTSLHHVALIAQRQGRWLVRRNPEGAWWHGLWDFPRVDITSLAFHTASRAQKESSFSDSQLQQVRQLANESLFPANTAARSKPEETITSIEKPLFTLSHGVTRYRIRLDCLPVEAELRMGQLGDDWQWADAESLLKLPLTSTAKKMVHKLVLL